MDQHSLEILERRLKRIELHVSDRIETLPITKSPLLGRIRSLQSQWLSLQRDHKEFDSFHKQCRMVLGGGVDALISFFDAKNIDFETRCIRDVAGHRR